MGLSPRSDHFGSDWTRPSFKEGEEAELCIWTASEDGPPGRSLSRSLSPQQVQYLSFLSPGELLRFQSCWGEPGVPLQSHWS